LCKNEITMFFVSLFDENDPIFAYSRDSTLFPPVDSCRNMVQLARPVPPVVY
jgi:hypothetical protein